MKAPHLLILMTISQINSFEKNCPMSSQWGFRSRIICTTTPEYYCLFDDNAKLNREFCRAKPDFLAPGNKYVIRGNLDGEECDKDSYQPFIYRTNETSRCALVKSKCKEEGQISHRNGSTTTDRSCRCDYTRNYAFVVQPQNPCYCDLSMEDCSCYIKQCPSRTHLSADYVCTSDYIWDKQSNCESIKVSRYFKPNHNIMNISMEYKKVNSTDHSILMLTVKIVILGFIVTGILGYLCIALKTSHEKKEVKPINIILSLSSPEKIELRCPIDENILKEKCSIEWQRKTNGAYHPLAEDGTKYELGHDHGASLMILNPRSDDAGEYIYKVVTKHGSEESKPFTLDKINVTQIEKSQCISKEIKLKCFINTNIKVTSIHWLGKLKDSNAYKALEDISKYDHTHGHDGTEPTLIILNPSAADAGDYICWVSTERGVGESETFTLDMKKGPVLSITGMERVNTKEEDYIPTPVDSQPPNTLLVGPSNSEMRQAQALLSAEIKRAKKLGEDYIKNELRIAIIGKSGTGKSSTANTIIGEKGFFKASLGADIVTERCQFERRNVLNRNILLIDTPGICGSTNSNDSDEIKKCVHIGSPGLHALLFVIRIDRMLNDDTEAPNTYIQYFGDEMKRHTIVVFTRVDELKADGQTIDDYVNSSQTAKAIVSKLGGRYVGFDNKLPKEDTTQVDDLLSQVELLVKEKEYAYSSNIAVKQRKEVEKKVKMMTDEIQNKIINSIYEAMADFFPNELSPVVKDLISAEADEMNFKKQIKEKCKEIAIARNEVRKQFLKTNIFQD